MAESKVTAAMKRSRKREHNRKRRALTNMQVAILKRSTGTHRRVDGAIMPARKRSRLGPTGHANICPGRCGVPVARDMDRCTRHQKAVR